MKAQADEVTLCQPHEEVYFSCPIGERIMSVCASGNISPDNGYVQYRFGQVGKIELEFPEKPFTPRQWFSISDISEANFNSTHLKFSVGQYRYVLYEGALNGIYIKKNGKLISKHVCNAGVYQAISPRALRGIKTVAPIEGLD